MPMAQISRQRRWRLWLSVESADRSDGGQFLGLFPRLGFKKSRIMLRIWYCEAVMWVFGSAKFGCGFFTAGTWACRIFLFDYLTESHTTSKGHLSQPWMVSTVWIVA